MDKPAVPKQAVVGPIGSGGADGDAPAAHGQSVHQEHHRHKDGQGQDTVGDDLVDLVRDGQTALGRFLLHGLGDHRVDVRIPLIGYNRLRIVVQFLFTVGYVLLQVGSQVGGETHFLHDLLIPLKNLDGVPAEIALRYLALDGFLNVGQGVFHAAGEHMGQLPGLLLLRQSHGLFRCRHAALALEGAHLDYLTAQGFTQLGKVDGVAVFPHQVDHVHGHYHGQAQLDQLGGKVEVPLDVGSVHNVEDGIRLLVHQIAPGHHLLQSVRGQGVDAGQVLDDHILMTLQPALLLFHGNTGPVTHVLAGAGEGVEQGGLAAVGVARQGNLDVHSHSLLSMLAKANLWRKE